MGTITRYSVNMKPAVFSTELAACYRPLSKKEMKNSVNGKGQLYERSISGIIHLRSDGNQLYMGTAFGRKPLYFFNVNQIMKDFPQRKPTRLQNFNYSEYRVYYVTICTKDRNPFFGGIIDKKMKLSIIGKVAEKCWLEIPDHFLEIELMGD